MDALVTQTSANRCIIVSVILLSAFMGMNRPRVLLGQAQEALPQPGQQQPVVGRMPSVSFPQPIQQAQPPSYGQGISGPMYPTANPWSPQTSTSGSVPSSSPLSAGGYTYPSTPAYSPWGIQSPGYSGMPGPYGSQQPPVWQGYLVKDPMTGSVINYYSDGRSGIAHWSSLSLLAADLSKVVTRSALTDYRPPQLSTNSFGAANPGAFNYYQPSTVERLATNSYDATSGIYRQQILNYQPAPLIDNQRLLLNPAKTLSVASNILTTTSMLKQAGILTNSGHEHLSSGRIEKALDSLDQALALSKVAGNYVFQAIIQSDIAHVNLSIGEARLALDHFNSANLASQSAASPTIQASSLRGMAAAHLALGESGQALQSLRRARSVLDGTNDKIAMAEIDVTMGWIHQSSGELKKALALYQEALSLMAGSGNRESEIRTRLGMGLLYQSLGESNKALDQYRRAVSVAETKDQTAPILASAGEVYRSVGMTAKALSFFDLAISLMKETGNRTGEAGALAGLARIHLSLGQLGRALYDNNEALRLMKELGNRLGEAAVEAGIGDVYYWAARSAYPELKSLPPSHQDYSIDDWRIAVPLGAPQFEYLQQALAHYSEALLIMSETHNHAGEFGILTSIGLVYDLLNKPKLALEYYDRAIEVLEGMRTTAGLEEFKAGLVQQSMDVYLCAFSLRLRLKQHLDAFALSERARARTLLDQLGNARINTRSGQDIELTSEEQRVREGLIALESRLWQERAKPAPEYKSEVIQTLDSRLIARRREYEDLLTRLKVSNPEYASIVSVDTLTLPQVQKLLNKDVTLVSYFVMPGNTVAFVVTPDSFHTHLIPVGENQLAAAIASFRDFPQLEQSNPPSLKQLYKWLIAPIKPHLKTPLLGIIPHGTLHYLPFAALTDGKKYLGDEYTIFHLPSASVLPFIKQKPAGGGEEMLAMAYGGGEGLPFLRYADQEARAIAGIYHTRALLGDSATTQAFRARAGEHNIVHLAAHYQPNPTNPLFSHLTLAPGEAIEGELEVREVYGMDLTNTDLVVLSACQSRLGAQSRGDDIVGLERAFMSAGVTTLIASLWSVDDQATSELMTSFFTHLKEGMTKAAALRLAQAQTRAKHPHPYYWAGFVLTGHPG